VTHAPEILVAYHLKQVFLIFQECSSEKAAHRGSPEVFALLSNRQTLIYCLRLEGKLFVAEIDRKE